MLEKLNIVTLGANQMVVTKGDYTAFYSYGTFIIEIKDYNKVTKVSSKYNYSVTTVKHLNKFLSHYCNEVSNKQELERIIKDRKIKLI